MRGKTHPELGDVEASLRARHPAIERGNDVGVSVRGQNLAQVLHRKIAPNRQQQFVIRSIATRVDQRACVAMHDEELVGLHRLAILFAQMGHHQANMPILVVQLYSHVTAFLATAMAGSLAKQKGVSVADQMRYLIQHK